MQSGVCWSVGSCAADEETPDVLAVLGPVDRGGEAFRALAFTRSPRGAEPARAGGTAAGLVEGLG